VGNHAQRGNVVSDETLDPYDALLRKLKATTRSTYIVNEKSPSHGYNRKWKIYVLFNDGTKHIYWADDNRESLLRHMRVALSEASRRGATS
jgi:hypothetical protein